jgi:hypothetical protein
MIVFTGKFKRWLDESFVSQDKAAQFLGVSRNHYRAVLFGKVGVGPVLIEAVKGKLGMDFEEAFEIREG